MNNSPVVYNDPSGYYACETINGYNCATGGEIKKELTNTYHWSFDGKWTTLEMKALLSVGMNMESYISPTSLYRGAAWIRNHLGNATFHHDKGLPCGGSRCHYVFPTHDVRLVRGFERKPSDVAHELAHVLDNNSAGPLPATFFGGGLADDLIHSLGGDPRKPTRGNGGPPALRFLWLGVNVPKEHRWDPGSYGNFSPADYFADTFRYSIYNPAIVPPSAYYWLLANLSNSAD